MRIVSAEFVLGAVGEKNSPEDELPEIAFAGRSNVGKSSLINRLVQRKKLARTSSSPGPSAVTMTRPGGFMPEKERTAP